MEGFTRAASSTRWVLHSADTAELHFENVAVPGANLLGQEGRGFYHLMTNLPSERLSIAISAIAGARATFTETLHTSRTARHSGSRSAASSTTGS